MTNIASYITAVCDLLSHEISGLLIRKLLQLDITIIKTNLNLIRGFLPLGEKLARRRSLINVRVYNSRCFHYSVACSLYYKEILDENNKNIITATGPARKALKRKLERSSTWDNYIQNMPLLDEPIAEDLEAITEYERLSSVSISIVKFCKKSKSIVPLRLTKVKMEKHIYLLLISRSQLPKKQQIRYIASHHFVSILSISSLLATRSKGYKFVCRFCFAMTNDKSHEQKCFDNDFCSLVLPKTQFYRFNEHFKLCMPPTMFFLAFSIPVKKQM